MALAKEMMGGGLSAGQAKAIGGGGGTITVTGASSSQALAALITTSNAILSGGDGTKSAVLPAVGVGESVTVFNNSASTVPVFPPVGSAIAVVNTGLGTANSSFALLTYKSATFTCQSATQWFVVVSSLT